MLIGLSVRVIFVLLVTKKIKYPFEQAFQNLFYCITGKLLAMQVAPLHLCLTIYIVTFYFGPKTINRTGSRSSNRVNLTQKRRTAFQVKGGSWDRVFLTCVAQSDLLLEVKPLPKELRHEVLSCSTDLVDCQNPAHRF